MVKQSLLIGGFIILLTSFGHAQLQFIEHTIDNNFGLAYSVYAIDLDRDDDVDVLGAANMGDDITWWQNDGSQDFTEHTIADNFDGARAVYAIDIDNDDDVDVVGAASGIIDLIWWENDEAQRFSENIIADTSISSNDIFAIDLDSDDDVDILGADYGANEITWHENDGNEEFTKHDIATNFGSAFSVYAIDLDGDNDIDVLGTAAAHDQITWWENDGNEEFTEHIITNNFDYPVAAYAIDLDSDEDVDVVGAAYFDDEIAWWENDGNQDFEEHTIADDFDGAWSVYAVDIEGDDDVDVLGAAGDGSEITWWENDGNEEFTEYTISDSINWAADVYATDLDGDGDADVLGAEYLGNKIIWWENNGTPPGEFELVSPGDGETLHDDTVTVNWTASEDPDGFEYIIEWSLFEEFPQDSTSIESTIDTFFVLTDVLDLVMTGGELDELPDDVTIYWRVQAVDELGAYAWANGNSTGWFFNTDVPDPPEPFNLLSPANGSNIQQSGTVVTWSETTDPDSYDTPSYEVWLDTLDDHSTSWQVGDRIDYTQRYISDLQADHDYFWTVRATDSNTDGTWASDTFYFNTDQNAVTDENIVEIPFEYSISSIHPNPFNSTVTIAVSLPETSHLKIDIYNILGDKVTELSNNRFKSGYHRFVFEGTGLASGIYIINARIADEMNEYRKVLLIR